MLAQIRLGQFIDETPRAYAPALARVAIGGKITCGDHIIERIDPAQIAVTSPSTRGEHCYTIRLDCAQPLNRDHGGTKAYLRCPICQTKTGYLYDVGESLACSRCGQIRKRASGTLPALIYSAKLIRSTLDLDDDLDAPIPEAIRRRDKQIIRNRVAKYDRLLNQIRQRVPKKIIGWL